MRKIASLLVACSLASAACARPPEVRPESERPAPPRAQAAAVSGPAASAAPRVVEAVAAAATAADVLAPEPPEGPAEVERLEVPGDVLASVVRGRKRAAPHTIFLPGLCSNAYAYLLGFPEAAKEQGGVVAIEGDQPCVPGFRSFSWDAPKLHRRIEAAFAASGVALGDDEAVTLVGYSQGAALAEQLVQRWPRRYARLVLIGAPTDPSPSHFRTAEGVVTMSCSLDVPWRMKEAARGIARTGVRSTYVEMPGCTHGNLARGDETLGAAFAFLR